MQASSLKPGIGRESYEPLLAAAGMITVTVAGVLATALTSDLKTQAAYQLNPFSDCFSQV